MVKICLLDRIDKLLTLRDNCITLLFLEEELYILLVFLYLVFRRAILKLFGKFLCQGTDDTISKILNVPAV